MVKKIAVIGGGAAGMMVVATLLESKVAAEVHLFEKNTSLGKKVIISGGGRCNVTTGITDLNALEKKYVRGMSFFKAALSNFPPAKVQQWFENHDVPLKTEEDFRVFPRSDRGTDIVNAFVRVFDQYQAHIHYAEPILNMQKLGQHFQLITAKQEYSFDCVVICSGGNAYRHTGSSGDGYAFAQACGHTITALGPSLNSFEVAEEWPKQLTGLSFPSARLQVVKTKEYMAVGPFLFTHFGVSGPMTFAFSAQVAFEPIAKQTPLEVSFEPRSDFNFEQWYRILQAEIDQRGAKQIHSLLDQVLPKRFVEVVLQKADIPLTKQAATLSKDERKLICHLLTGRMIFTLTARRPGDEFVTAGGVDTAEIDRKTLESKLCPGLYFAGEVLNIDGITGGFNLQVAWATGRLVGESIVKCLAHGKS